MPWREVSVMENRRELIRLVEQEGANRRELCRRFGISAETGYKWLRRWQGGGHELADRSRRPHASPARCPAELEAAVLEVRDAHPAWGARKLRRCLERASIAPPAASTVHAILSRHGRINGGPASAARPYCRFERQAPNLLWQMDLKGWVALSSGARCHLPEAMFVDNGSPWGDASGGHWTRLAAWLLKRPSARPMPERLPQVEYEAHEIVRTVPETKDYVRFRGRGRKVPQAFRGERVAIRPLSSEGCFGVFFAAHQIAAIDLHVPPCAATIWMNGAYCLIHRCSLLGSSLKLRAPAPDRQRIRRSLLRG